MSGYTTSVTKSFICEGEEFEVEFTRLKRKHLLKIYPELKKFQEEQAKGAEPDAEVVIGLMDKMFEFITEYIVEIRGLKAKNGAEITAAELFEDVYFMAVATEVATAIIEASFGPLGKTSNS